MLSGSVNFIVTGDRQIVLSHYNSTSFFTNLSNKHLLTDDKDAASSADA